MAEINTTLRNRLNVIIIISGTILSSLIAFDTTTKGIIAALVTAPAVFVIYRYLCRNYQYAEKYLRFQNDWISYYTLLLSIYALYMLSDIAFSSGLGSLLLERYFANSRVMLVIGSCVLSVLLLPAVYAFFNWLVRLIFRMLTVFLRQMDRYEKIISMVFLAAVFVALLVTYMQTSIFSNCFYINPKGDITYRAVDTLLDTDSPYVLHNMMDIRDVNARHIIYKILQLPITIPATLLSLLFAARDQAFALMMCLTASMELLLTALMAARLAKERFLLPLLLCSYPYLLYSMVYERNQLAVLLLLVTVTLNLGDNRDSYGELGKLASVGAAAGVTTTSALIGLFVLREKSVRVYLQKGLTMIALLIGMVLMAGKAKLFLSLDFAYESFMAHSNTVISFGSRLLHYTESVRSMLFPSHVYVESVVEYGATQIQAVFNTVNRMDFYLSIIGIAVIILALIGFFVHRKNTFAKACLGWCGCHVLIFPVLGFSGTTYLLHAVMFSWAYLSLAYKGFIWCTSFIPEV